ncbi:TetR/AcrR family transcriptional regulator [Planktotalea arctica]|uniref:TetR/AcrR family transcriptional regulator n=1 Tax=Planktotalea arctica TaxID=1481893 RepID=UPI000A17009B|nr:TetR/AcrR family transcriptional regulator [Planktotalea arctica]
MIRETPESEKQKLIAKAAFAVFAEHGFRKTSMQRIADKAGMSRPALYLHFQSKEDVFNFLVLGYLNTVQRSILARLAQSGSPAAVIGDLFAAFDPDGIKEVLLDAKHGNELMDIKSGAVLSRAEEIAQNICSALADWLRREAHDQRIICEDPVLTAQTIMSSYDGLKNPAPSYAIYKARSAALAQLLGKGLLP